MCRQRKTETESTCHLGSILFLLVITHTPEPQEKIPTLSVASALPAAVLIVPLLRHSVVAGGGFSHSVLWSVLELVGGGGAGKKLPVLQFSVVQAEILLLVAVSSVVLRFLTAPASAGSGLAASCEHLLLTERRSAWRRVVYVHTSRPRRTAGCILLLLCLSSHCLHLFSLPFVKLLSAFPLHLQSTSLDCEKGPSAQWACRYYSILESYESQYTEIPFFLVPTAYG